MEDFAIKEFNNILKNQRAKDRTILVLALLFVVMIIAFCISLIAIIKYFDNSRLVVKPYMDTFEVSSISKEESIIIDCKSHIAFFCDHFYSFDATNVEEQVNKALWVSDNSVKRLFGNYKANDWYNKIVQLNIFQTCELSDIKVDITKKPYRATFSGTIFLKQEYQVEKFKFTASCELENTTKQFPNNQFGFMITKYVQSDLTK
jgi:hypothetical protein